MAYTERLKDEVKVLKCSEVENFFSVEDVASMLRCEKHVVAELCRLNRITGAFKAKFMSPIKTKSFWLVEKDYQVKPSEIRPKRNRQFPGLQEQLKRA